MSVLQVGNLHFESTGNNRLQYTGSNAYLIVAGGANIATINTTSLTLLNTSSIAIGNLSLGTTISGGMSISAYNLGTLTSGTTTLSGLNGNYQYYTNNGAHTIAAPTADTAIDILVTNGASAGAITLSGFTAPSGGGGSVYATTNGQRFLLMVRRINGVSTYVWKALQ